jgi:hypothetical protein
MERDMWGSYRHGESLKQQGLMRIEGGSYDGEEMVSGVDFGQRRKTTGNRGPPIGEGKRERGIPVRVCGEVGRGPILMPG